MERGARRQPLLAAAAVPLPAIEQEQRLLVEAADDDLAAGQFGDGGDVVGFARGLARAEKMRAALPPGVQTGMGADQQLAVGGLSEHAHARIVQAVGFRMPGQCAVVQFVQAFGGAEPDVPALVPHDGRDLRMPHRFQCRHRHDAPVARICHAAAGADPQPVFAIGQQGVGRGVGQSGTGYPRVKEAVHPLLHAVVGAGEHGAAGAGGQRPQDRVLQAFTDAVSTRPAVPQAGGAVEHAAQPQVAFAVFENGTECHRAMLAGDPLAHPAVAQAHHVFAERDPQVAVAVFLKGFDRLRAQPRVAGVSRPAAAFEPEQALAGAGPQPALGKQQAVHAGADHRARQRVARRRAVALEQQGAIVAADPQAFGAGQQAACRLR